MPAGIIYILIQEFCLEIFLIMCTNDSFLTKVWCEFFVKTNDRDTSIVTGELGLTPTRSYNKGDMVFSKSSKQPRLRPWGIWAIRTKTVLGEGVDLTPHIDYFEELLGSKLSIIEKLEKTYHFECSFQMNIETEDAGEGFDLSTAELAFISKISSRFTCFFLANKQLGDHVGGI